MNEREAVLALAGLFGEIAKELRRLAAEEPEEEAAPAWPRQGSTEPTPSPDDWPELIE